MVTVAVPVIVNWAIVPLLVNEVVVSEISPEFVTSVFVNWKAMVDPVAVPESTVPLTSVLDAPLGPLHAIYPFWKLPVNGPVV